ncbi:hypothetical protein IW146_001954 [Coemansia sp. RSA 922]|nr:hypothetical protein IW146_001954 [Coemansia sp. RSA 922]
MSRSSRAHKPVSYFEQTFDASDDSDFEQPSPSAKAPAKKRGRQPKAPASSVEPKSSPAKKKTKHGDFSDEGSDDDHEPHHREGTAETEQISSSPVRRPTEAADEGDRSPPSSRAAPSTAKRGARRVRDDSDSDEEFDQGSGSESDYGGKKVVGKGKKAAETAKPKPTATATAARPATSRVKKAAAPAVKKVAATTPVKKAAPVVARPVLKKSSSSQLGSLLKSPSRPTSPKATRPLLMSAGSSGSLSLQLSPGSVRRTGVRGGGGSSLMSLLGGSAAPRAGLSRRTLPKK